jgi:Ca2+/Na+ antiporter
MLNGILLNNLILYSTALLIYSEVKTWHMDIIFMSSVYPVYVWTCLKLFQDVHSKWSNERKHYCFKWPLSLVTSCLVAHVIYQAHTPCLIPILLTGKVVWCVWLICGHSADFCMTKMLNTVATSAVINSDEDFHKWCLCRENNLQINEKFLGSRFQENMQEVHVEKKLDIVVLDWRRLHEIFLPILHSKWVSASSPSSTTKLIYLHRIR